MSLTNAIIMAGGERAEFVVDLPDPDGLVPLDHVTADVAGVRIAHVDVVVEFTDMAGRRWRRGRRGDPERILDGR